MTETLNIDRGDTVRIRNGETFVVAETCISYHDAQGDHEGPFVSPNGGRDWYPVSDVLEVVATNPNRCDLCGGGVDSADPEKYPYCQFCHYSGAVANHLREDQLGTFRRLLPDATVGIEHTGGGCFCLAVRFQGEADYYVLTDGDACLPEETTGGWGYVGLHSDDEESPHYEGTPLRDYRGRPTTDLGAVALIQDDRGKRMPPRGVTRVQAQNRAFTKGFKLTVPAAIARAVGPDRLFEAEVTEDGILYRYVGGAGPDADEAPGWLR